MKKTKNMLAGTVMAGAIVMQGAISQAQPGPSVGTNSIEAIRPFKVHVAEADLIDLRKRILATRWPERETVTDQSQGVKLSQIKNLVQYWGTGYDWRKAEAKL